jgi:hypothetical protein
MRYQKIYFFLQNWHPVNSASFFVEFETDKETSKVSKYFFEEAIRARERDKQESVIFLD